LAAGRFLAETPARQAFTPTVILFIALPAAEDSVSKSRTTGRPATSSSATAARHGHIPVRSDRRGARRTRDTAASDARDNAALR
jgi:hypothetical protein